MEFTLNKDIQNSNIGSIPWSQLRLPPFSPVALRVLELAGSESVQLHELSALISSDPALATEVLCIVNSLLYAPRFPVTSILQAIAVLGANHLQGLCLAVGVRGYIGKSISHPAMLALWRHNLACATIAEQLASAGFIDKDIAFTCGVMHDIGRIALAAVRPKEYTNLLSTFIGSPKSLVENERHLFGLDHCEIGRQLVHDWRLPEEFSGSICEHHNGRHPEGQWNMTNLINLSCRLADAIGFPAFAFCQSTPFPDLRAEIPLRERKTFHSEAGVLLFDVMQRIHAIESI